MSDKIFKYILKTLMSKIRHQLLDNAMKNDNGNTAVDLEIVDRIICGAFSEVIDIDDP